MKITTITQSHVFMAKTINETRETNQIQAMQWTKWPTKAPTAHTAFALLILSTSIVCEHWTFIILIYMCLVIFDYWYWCRHSSKSYIYTLHCVDKDTHSNRIYSIQCSPESDTEQRTDHSQSGRCASHFHIQIGPRLFILSMKFFNSSFKCIFSGAICVFHNALLKTHNSRLRFVLHKRTHTSKHTVEFQLCETKANQIYYGYETFFFHIFYYYSHSLSFR